MLIAVPLSIISYVNMAESNGILLSEEDIQKLIESGQYVLLNETNHESNEEISELSQERMNQQRLSVIPKKSLASNNWAVNSFTQFLTKRGKYIDLKTIIPDRLAVLLQLFYSTVS